ncbi:MAG: hypothetical protein ACMG55_19985, partial [Microcoleus sp.]
LHGLMLAALYRLTDLVLEKRLVARTPDPLIQGTSNHFSTIYLKQVAEMRKIGGCDMFCYVLGRFGDFWEA